MRYAKTVLLTGGVELLVRNAVASDARALRETTQRTHAETDYLLSYPDEQNIDDEQEARSLEETERSGNEVELVAVIDGQMSEDEAVESIALATRQLARRQVKWLRPDPRVHWLDVEDFGSNEAVVRHVVELTQREAEAALGRS